MLSEILKLIPRIDPKSLATMERTLSSRFVSIGKRFASGIKNALLGGGIIGAGLALADKFLNPLKEVQEAIDSTLKRADDIVTNAQLFDSTPGKLAKLQQFAIASGLDAEGLDQLLIKYRSAIAEAKNDPAKKTSVRQFANDKDIVESFFNFIQGLQGLRKTDSLAAATVENEIFGEKQIKKAADFLQADFGNLAKELRGVSADKLNVSLKRLGDLQDKIDINNAKRFGEEVIKKNTLIKDSLPELMDKAERKRIQHIDDQIKSYADLANMSIAVEEIKAQFQNLYTEMAKGVIALLDISKLLSGMSTSRWARGLFEKAFGKPPGN